MTGMAHGGSKRKVNWLGLTLTLAIILAVIAFGLFKRKGARKPPPIPDGTEGHLLVAPHAPKV